MNMKNLIVFLITVLMLTMVPTAHADYRHHQARSPGHVSIVIPIIAAAAVVTAAVIMANHPAQPVQVVQAYPTVIYAPGQNPGINLYDSPEPYVPPRNPYNE
jgi:spore maturation protein SpmA